MKNLLENINMNDYEIVKKRPRLVIALDMDDVLNDNISELIRIWNKETNNNKTIDDCLHWDLTKDFDDSIVEIFKRKGYFRNLPAKKNAVETVKVLINNVHYEVYIVSACQTIQEYAEKYEWIQEKIPNFKMSKFISCSEKDVIRADIIVDDRAETLIKCRPYMDIVAVSAPYNQYLECTHINDLSEIIAIAEKAYAKKYK